MFFRHVDDNIKLGLSIPQDAVELSENRKKITFTDKNNIGQVKLKGTRDLNWYDSAQIKKVRIVRRADGYYCQILVDVATREKLEPSYSEIGWYQFRVWVEYFGYKFGKITIAVPPQHTSINCSDCGAKVKKALSTRTHKCKCGCILDRDENAARNILSLGLNTAGRAVSAWGDNASI